MIDKLLHGYRMSKAPHAQRTKWAQRQCLIAEGGDRPFPMTTPTPVVELCYIPQVRRANYLTVAVHVTDFFTHECLFGTNSDRNIIKI